MLKTIYAISTGEYSDYTVRGLFEDRDTAELWLKEMLNGVEDEKQYRYYSPRIEEFILISSDTKPFKVTKYSQSVTLWDDGRTDYGPVQVDTDYPIMMWNGPPSLRPSVRYVRAPVHSDKGGRLEVVANNLEALVKVINEKVMMWKAGSWGGPKHQEIIEE